MELLIVVAILAILIALLGPSLKRTLYKTTVLECQHNLKNNGIAFTIYSDDYNGFYPRNTNWRSSITDLGAYGSDDDHIREILLPYLPSMEQSFRCVGSSELIKGKNLDTASSWDTLSTDYAMYFSVRYTASNGQGRLGMDKYNGYKTIKPELQMLTPMDTWTPNFVGRNSDTEGPSFDFLMSDINSNKGNHANPDFYSEEGTHWSTTGYWTFPYGGRQEANYLFSDGRVEFMEAYHDFDLFKTWYHGFGISPLPKIWNRGNRPF